MDITLPETVQVMDVKKQTGTLDNSLFKLSRSVFIPAHETVSVTLEDDLYCEPGKGTKECFAQSYKETSQVVIFDGSNRYEIRFEMPRQLKSEFK